MSISNDKNLYVLTGRQIFDILKDRETEILETVSRAYKYHGEGDDFLPRSVFLRFPNNADNRIIGLPAYVGGDFKKAGIKWIASYPDNHKAGLDRASATIILNSFETGNPIAVLEGSIISVKRTAASAALAAKHLLVSENVEEAGLIGCGLVNFETLRFLQKVVPSLKKIHLFDINRESSENFKAKVLDEFPELTVEIEDSVLPIFHNCLLVSLATTSSKPYLDDITECREGVTILHISLRDFSTEVIESAVNVVDDADHVCTAQTSIHLTEQKNGSRDFIHGSLPDILLNKIAGRQNVKEKIIFSPFGLGILDIALSEMVFTIAKSEGQGIEVESFLPDYWLHRK